MLCNTGREQSVSEYVAEGRPLFDGSISWPAMILRKDASDHNITMLVAFCRRHGLGFAPHGKTSMAPTLFHPQLDAGAWGITVATAQQLQVARRFGIDHVLVAHQILDAAALDWMAAELAHDPEFETARVVGSPEGVAAAAAAARRQHGPDEFPVLVGVCTYEGGLPDTVAVRGYVAARGSCCAAAPTSPATTAFTPVKPPITASPTKEDSAPPEAGRQKPAGAVREQTTVTGADGRTTHQVERVYRIQHHEREVPLTAITVIRDRVQNPASVDTWCGCDLDDDT